MLAGSGDYGDWESRDQAVVAGFGEGGAGDSEENGGGECSALVWVGKMGIVEREFEPLPLADAYPYAERALLDESGAGRGGVFVGTAAGEC